MVFLVVWFSGYVGGCGVVGLGLGWWGIGRVGVGLFGWYFWWLGGGKGVKMGRWVRFSCVILVGWKFVWMWFVCVLVCWECFFWESVRLVLICLGLLLFCLRWCVLGW